MSEPKRDSAPPYDRPPLTYRQLKASLDALGEDQLDEPVSLLRDDANEVYPIFDTILISELPKERREELEDVIGTDAAVIVF